MKLIIYILTFLILTSCGQSNSEEKIEAVSDLTATDNYVESNIDSIEKDNNEIANSGDGNNGDDNQQRTLSDFQKATLFKLSDTIIADFNGDGIKDKAFLQREKKTSGIIIKHGQTNEMFRIGFGKNFGGWEEFDCDWVDYWGLVEDKETIEVSFTDDGDVAGSQQIKLQNLSIVIGADEVGGGLITFRNGKYVWIHQTC